jgi:hypothetical protein
MAQVFDRGHVGPLANFGDRARKVLLTYVTHRYWWWIGGGLSLFAVLIVLLTGPTRRGTNESSAAVVVFPMLFLNLFLVSQAKSQFAHARARLMPGFQTAHLFVLGSMLAVLYGLLPLAVALRTGDEPLGILALAGAIGASMVWGTHLNRFWPTMIGLAIFYSMLSPWGRNFWINEAAFYRPIHAVIFFTSSVLVASWLWRLAHINEEMDDYQNTLVAMLARRTGSEAIEQRRIVATQVTRSRLFAWVGDWWHAQLGGYYGGNPAGLARLLRYGFAAVPLEVNGLIFALMAFCMIVGFKQFDFLGRNPGSISGFFLVVQFGVLMPGQLAGEILAQRRPRIASELLLPISRGQLIDGLFAAIIRNTGAMWLIVHVAIGLALLLTETQIAPWTIVVFVLLSLATTVAVMGVCMRTSIWPSLFKRISISLLAWLVLLPPIMAWGAMREKQYAALFLVLAALLIAVGLILVERARRAWLALELG